MSGTTRTGPGRPPKTEAPSTRNRILDTAIHLFAQKGFHGTSVRDISQGVGIKVSSIYNHFEGKDGILAAILEEYTSTMEGTVLTAEDIDERLDAVSHEEFWRKGLALFMAQTGDPRIEKTSRIVSLEMYRDERARDIALQELFARQQVSVELIFTRMKMKGLLGDVEPWDLALVYAYGMLGLSMEFSLLSGWGMETGPVEEKMFRLIRFIAGVSAPRTEN
jgi:AcrR family transcriptional regulator